MDASKARFFCITWCRLLDDDVDYFLGWFLVKDIRDVVCRIKLCCYLDPAQDDRLALSKWNKRN